MYKVVDIRVGGGVGARDGHLRRRLGTTAGDGNLSAGNVPLRSTSNVQANLLDPEKILEEVKIQSSWEF
jgi:hypothetical protein